jgi:hypothetical protein
MPLSIAVCIRLARRIIKREGVPRGTPYINRYLL